MSSPSFSRHAQKKRRASVICKSVFNTLASGCSHTMIMVKINLLNSAAKRLLEVTHLKNISQLERRSVALVNTLKSLKPDSAARSNFTGPVKKCNSPSTPLNFLMQSERFRLVSIQNIGSNSRKRKWKPGKN
ncbi:MAG: hypothetical protein R3C26_20695 [Calditrichia bacterium]